MFTGIIETTGELTEITRDRLTIKTDLVSKLRQGGSISVDGICLTATEVSNGQFTADVMPETVSKTNLSSRKPGDLVNLEPAMPADGRFDGHIVTGHIEGAGQVKSIDEDGDSHVLTIEVPKNLTRYIVPKGSIACNGISLTVVDIQKNLLTIAVIPHTWELTNFHTLQIDDKVNIETDLMAKYFEKWQA